MDGYKTIDPDMDVRRLSKKLFPCLWVHYGVITSVPPAGPMSPAQVTDIADKMAEAVIVFAYSLRPVLQYYLEKYSRSMEGSKISFWTHLSFLCLRIRLRRDHPFDYLLNATAVVAECAVTCGGSGLDEVHAWAATFFCAFFEHELVGPFYSAGGWAGLVNYVLDGGLLGVFKHLPPANLEGSAVLVAVASEPLSAARRERVTAARALRGDEIERFEPAKVLAAKIFRWDFAEKFPVSGCFRRKQNIRRRKSRSKSESTDAKLYYVDVEPCASSSAPNLRFIDHAKPRLPITQRSTSIDVKSKLADMKRPYATSSLQLDINSEPSLKFEDQISSAESKADLTSSLQRSPGSISFDESVCSVNTSFATMKAQSKISPKSLLPILIDKNQTSTPNLQALEKGSYGASKDCRQRFSLPNSNRRTLIDLMQEKNPSVFQTYIWKDDFTLRKSKETKDQLSDTDLNKEHHKNSYSSRKKTLSLEDICRTSVLGTERKNFISGLYFHQRTSDEKINLLKTHSNTNIANSKHLWSDDSNKTKIIDSIESENAKKHSKVNQSSCWSTSYESMSSLGTDVKSNTDVGNSINFWTDDSKTTKSIDSLDSENVRKHSNVNQTSCWNTSYESMSSLGIDAESNTDVTNSKNFWTDDSIKTDTVDSLENESVRKRPEVNQMSHGQTSHESKTFLKTDAASNFENSKHIWTTNDFPKNETEDLSKFVAKLLLINVTDDSEQDKSHEHNRISEDKNEQMYMKSSDMDSTSFISSREGKGSESLPSSSNHGTCKESKEGMMSQHTHSSNSTGTRNDISASVSPISQHSGSKSFGPSETLEGGEPLITLSPSTDKSDSDDGTERVIIQTHTQTVLYKRRLLSKV